MTECEIVENPGDAVYQKFVDLYREINWSCFRDMYKIMLGSYKPGNFQFYTALSKDSGAPVSSIMLGRYEPVDGSLDITCIGAYYTVPSERNLGIAQLVWKTALSGPEKVDRPLALIGTDSMHEKYAQKYGFDKYFDSPIVVYERLFEDLDVSRLETEEGVRIVEFDEADYRKVLAYDVVVSGNQRRDAFLKTWMHSEGMLAAKVALNTHGDVVGYVGMADMAKFIKPSPLYAVNPSVASTLLKSALEELKSTLPGETVLKTVKFESNKDAQLLFDRLTAKKTFVSKCYGQFTHIVPKVDYNQAFCLTELALNVI